MSVVGFAGVEPARDTISKEESEDAARRHDGNGMRQVAVAAIRADPAPLAPRVAIYADVSVALFLVHRPPCNPLNSSGCPTAARANALFAIVKQQSYIVFNKSTREDYTFPCGNSADVIVNLCREP